ncbi:granulin-like, partial [Aphelenchoides avenae]
MRLTLVLLIVLPLLTSAKICPDQKSRCPQGSTCCPIGDDRYGCCPQENAVCCNDHEHCCPEDTQCDLVHERCVKGSRDFPLHRKQPAEEVFFSNAFIDSDEEETVETVVDIDVHERLAVNSHKQKVLPPLPREEPLWPMPVDDELPSLPSATEDGMGDVTCSDGRSVCPDGTTCCPTSEGVYGCCPAEQAVCCQDHRHCCPHGTQCDTAHGRCIDGSGFSQTWLRKLASKPIPQKEVMPIRSESVGDVTCSDGKSKCPDHTTCCPIAEGIYGCCPAENAVCCEDHVHCCPQGTTCDTAQGTCTGE